MQYLDTEHGRSGGEGVIVLGYPIVMNSPKTGLKEKELATLKDITCDKISVRCS